MPTAEFYFLGPTKYDAWLALQERLVHEAAQGDEPRINIVFCEHPELITVGRSGSRAHVRLSNEQLRRRQLDMCWVSRGGGCVLHAPGQLAVYPIVPLATFGWSVGDYLRRLQSALAAALSTMRIPTQRQPGRFTLVGRAGPLVLLGSAVKHWVTCHGAFVNVNPQMRNFGYVDVLPPQSPGHTTMSCLVAERRRPVRMSAVRSAIVPQLALALDCDRHHLHTGHPFRLQGTF